MATLTQKIKIIIKKHKKKMFEKTKHKFYIRVVKKLISLSSPMLCDSHFCPFSPISQVKKKWPQAKRAATYQVKC
jgi:hypothetical protein